MKNLLEVNKISKSYQSFELQDVSFELPSGFIMGYVGRNGAGKTTTLNLITRICNPDQGSIRINGITYEEDPIHYKEQIGFIGDESYFPNDFTIKSIRMVMKDHYQTFDEEKFNQFIKQWELPEKKKVETFSRGMKVKLMFACALSRKTSLLILDEATNGLDPMMREEILDLLQKYIEDGTRSILFSTHMLSDLEQIADYIIFIENGKIILDDAKDELLEAYITVKGKKEDLTGAIEKRAIGLTKNAYGFEALLSSDDAELINKSFVVERPSIDKIMVHILKNKGVNNYGSI
ncbi:MAG: ABC transporter ATP-binding protein [bacterium]|nr:ABC transporter ATP-binding protein [bacterium]